MPNADLIPPADPWNLFRDWYALAQQHEPKDPQAMALATVAKNGAPSLRIVLLRGFGVEGFTFFTNRESRKGTELLENPRAAVCMHWKSLDRQVRAEGPVSVIGDAESDAYFAGRPRASQIGAWASLQSRPLKSRETLEERVRDAEKRFEGQTVPRPPYWGGFRLAPLRIEFWQEREFRLHDRIVYHRAGTDASWAIERLYP